MSSFYLYIEHLPHCYSARFYLELSVWEHLPRALPTEMIFDRLRISLDRDLCFYSTELKLDTLEIIVKWLQVSVSEYNRQTPQTKNPLCV